MTPRDPRSLSKAELAPEPVAQFRSWYSDAERGGVHMPESMTLATAGPDGRPSSRVVLLKECDERGFVFYTNRQSRKGRELSANPWASLLFHWSALERQVRVEGAVTLVSDEESDAYFATRPYGSRIGAWASEQSVVLPERASLEQLYAEIAARYPGPDVPRPPHWGGYRLEHVEVEFWQGRESRLHDRFRYRRTPDGAWHLERLAP
jgi:pyridoxamine 5'-phosphate oxidase